MLDPAAVALKFGFIAVLYVFLLWMARSALRDLRRTAQSDQQQYAPMPMAAPVDEGTGLYQAAQGLGGPDLDRMPKLRVETAAGLHSGAAYDVSQGAVLGRGAQADIQLEDTFASSRHAQLVVHGAQVVIEDLASTNGTYLNGEPLTGPQPLHPGDRIRIGDSEFSFER